MLIHHLEIHIINLKNYKKGKWIHILMKLFLINIRAVAITKVGIIKFQERAILNTKLIIMMRILTKKVRPYSLK
jgi:hypothetical protein